MGKPLPKNAKDQWKEHILKQRQSGLSIKGWCKLNNLQPHSFYYWLSKLFPKISDQSDFREILDQDQAPDFPQSRISIEYKSFVVRIDPKFDQITLKECLSVLKEVQC